MKRHTILTIGILMFMLAIGGTAFGAHEWGEGQANVNTATKDQLVWFLGRSQVDNPEQLADDIIAYRDSNGPFSSMDELKNVTGVDDTTFDQMRVWMKLEGKTDYEPEKTVQPNPKPYSYGNAEEHWR